MKESLSFAFEVKQEVLTYQKHPKNINSFLHGFILANAIFEEDSYILRIKSEQIREKIILFLERIRVNYSHKKETKTYINILKKDFKISEEISFPSSFFAGVFCGGGNISSKHSTSYHLELSSHYENHIELITNKLNAYDFNFNVFKRENKWFAYIKKIDQLSDFLVAIEAKIAYFALQELKIQRDFENSVNRVQNIDFSNQTKTAESSIKHIKNINFVFENKLENNFSKNQIIFFKIKLKNPSLTLSELSAMLLKEKGINISKSGLNHWLLKLKNVISLYTIGEK